jgi:hypothetical protein
MTMTVYRLPHHCWTVVPKLPLDAYDPHLAAIREAWDEDRDWTFDDRLRVWWREFQYRLTRLRPGAPRPRQLAARCWLIQCDGCEQHIDDWDEGYTAHCESRTAAEETLAAYEFVCLDDLVFCPEDAPTDGRPAPPSPAEQEAAGQLPLPRVIP